MDIETIRKKLMDRNWAEVARRTGVSYVTIRRICLGGDSMDYRDFAALVDYLTRES